MGLPFWLAGSQATPARLAAALQAGAAGIQVGTAFAFCEQSGITADLKERVLRSSRDGSLDVFTDPLASPTGFPFKIAGVEGTLSAREVYAARERVCDLGYLRQSYRKADGTMGYRCASEPEEDYVAKGGDRAETLGRKCVCNGLLATIGIGQARGDDGREPALVTAGDDVRNLTRFLPAGQSTYAAADVVRYLLGEGRSEVDS